MYSPDSINGTIKNNPVYRSSSVLTDNDDEHHHHQHQHQHQHQHSDEDSDYSISNIQITPAAFMNMCPALLVQIEQGSCAEQQQQQQHFDDISLPLSSSSAESLPSVEPKASKEISSFGKWFSFFLDCHSLDYSKEKKKEKWIQQLRDCFFL